MNSFFLKMAAGAALSAGAMSAGWCSDAYPTKPVRLVVPYPAGGSGDVMARLIGQKLSELWGQQVVIDNRPGANGIIGTNMAAKSPPDGYTLYEATDGPVSINPSLYTKMPYDWKTDFVPVSQVALLNQALLVNSALPARSVQELVALAKKKPGQLNYGSMGAGSSPHLGAEMFKAAAEIDMTHVPYSGSSQAVTGLIAGEVSAFFVGISTAAPFVQSGKVRALAVTSKQRSEVLPDVPTFAESGFPNLELSIWFGILAPAGTPPAIVAKVNADVRKVLEDPGLRSALQSRGFEPRSSSSEELRTLIEKDQDRWGALIKKLGLKLD